MCYDIDELPWRLERLLLYYGIVGTWMLLSKGGHLPGFFESKQWHQIYVLYPNIYHVHPIR